MNWKDIGATVGKFAPLLGTALGGPLGGAVGSIVSSALGVDNTPDAVAAAMAVDPQIVVKLKEIESSNEASLREYQFKTLDVELKDIQNAREINKLSIMPALITCVMTFMSFLFAVALFYVEFPESNRDMINNFGGQLVLLWISSIVYWIGTTRSSAEKNRILAQTDAIR